MESSSKSNESILQHLSNSQISLKLGIKVDKSLSVSSTQVTTLYVLSLSVSKSLNHLHC